MPNAYDYTIIITGADSKTFKVVEDPMYLSYAKDKYNVYHSCKVVDGLDPNNPETWR